ncbi:MAG: hypothetical protein O7C75_04605 [Verrucomicrobia bacterium]|nr:hypothetical protein [Verrucomicrobiota bacterium]
MWIKKKLTQLTDSFPLLGRQGATDYGVGARDFLLKEESWIDISCMAAPKSSTMMKTMLGVLVGG